MESSKTSLNLALLSDVRWIRLADILSSCVSDVAATSAVWIESTYPRIAEIRALSDFVASNLSDGVRGDIGSITRVWFFPWMEAQSEIEFALGYAVAGLHRASLDHARRALELVVIGAYFVADGVSEEAGAAWLSSRDETPAFSRALKALAKETFPHAFFGQTGWNERAKAHYWMLSDSVHVRGKKYSLHEVQNTTLTLGSFPVPGFSARSLSDALDTLIETYEHILVALVLANPILLFGVPVEEKYGINGPVGFYEKHQADRLRELLPAQYRDTLVELAQREDFVRGVLQHFADMPDIAQEVLDAQVRDFGSRYRRDA